VNEKQTDVPIGPRPDDLFAPVDGDHGSHGVFDKEAKSKAFRPWVRLVTAAAHPWDLVKRRV